MTDTVIIKAPITRKGSGRTKGAFSFVNISLAKLNAHFKNPDTEIRVGRKFLEAAGVPGLVTASATKLAEANTGVAEAPVIHAVDLDDV